MKKLFALALIVCLLALTSACQKQDYFNRVSQIRSEVFVGESQTFLVKAYLESREYPLQADGFAGELKGFLIIKLTYKSGENSLINDLSADFSIDKQYSVTFAFKPDADAYVATTAIDQTPNDSVMTITVNYGNSHENATLNAVNDGAISYRKALDAVTNAKKSLLSALIDSDADFEIMLRLIYEKPNLYYYVGIVETEYTTAYLINDKYEIIAEKRLKNQ